MASFGDLFRSFSSCAVLVSPQAAYLGRFGLARHNYLYKAKHSRFPFLLLAVEKHWNPSWNSAIVPPDVVNNVFQRVKVPLHPRTQRFV